jgi:hypothetical protein
VGTESVREERVPEDKPSDKDPAPGAVGVSVTEQETGKDARSVGLLFVLAVYGASRIFYLAAGALLAVYLPAGPFHWLTPDVPLGRLNSVLR